MEVYKSIGWKVYSEDEKTRHKKMSALIHSSIDQYFPFNLVIAEDVIIFKIGHFFIITSLEPYCAAAA